MISHGDRELVASTKSQDEPLEGDHGWCERRAVWRIMHRVRPEVLEKRRRHGPLQQLLAELAYVVYRGPHEARSIALCSLSRRLLIRVQETR